MWWINSFNWLVSIDVDASGPLEFFTLTCFSINIDFEFFCFLNAVNSTDAVLPNVWSEKPSDAIASFHLRH